MGPFIIVLCFLPGAFAIHVLIFIFVEFELILKLHYRDSVGEPISDSQPLRATTVLLPTCWVIPSEASRGC